MKIIDAIVTAFFAICFIGIVTLLVIAIKPLSIIAAIIVPAIVAIAGVITITSTIKMIID